MTDTHEARGLSPAALNALGVAEAEKYAASFAAEDYGWDAQHAREEMESVRLWEELRAGRELRLWEAVIETRAAALDADDAWHRLSLYMRHPLHRTGDDPSLHMTWDIEDSPMPASRRELAPIEATDLEEAERRRLAADYPRGVFADLATRGKLYGAWEQAHVADYCETLVRAARMIEQGRGLTEDDRARWAADLDAERGPLPGGVTLTYWRAHHRVEFLAGHDEASARERAEELAATVIDYAGRPLGQVVAGSIRPDDGFRNAVDGRWTHPAASTIGEPGRSDLWEEYAHVERRAAAGDAVGSRPVLRDLYLLGAEQLRERFAQSTGEHTAHEARLHTQPDGTRTYTTPGAMRIVIADALRQAAGKTPAELLAMAQDADHLARRVYGKVVETDDDVRRIEATERRARVWAKLAEDIEAVTALAGEQAAGWPLQGVTWQRAGREDGPGDVLEIRAATGDGDTDLVGLWTLGEDGKVAGPYQVVLLASSKGRLTAPYPLGFTPPDPARATTAERSRWLESNPNDPHPRPRR